MKRSTFTHSLALAFLLALVTGMPSFADETMPEDFVHLRDVDPSILQEIRYFTEHNFLGRPVEGYEAAECVLTRPAAEALAGVQANLKDMGLSLKVYDCYRPQRAVDDFVAWAKDLEDTVTKAEFYPDIDKSKLFELGYIASKSGHSRGSTMDLTIVPLPPTAEPSYDPNGALQACYNPVGERFADNSLDFGTGYDCFDPLSHTDNREIDGNARENRQLLVEEMSLQGFVNYDKEWWHFTLDNEPFPDTYFNFPVTQGTGG